MSKKENIITHIVINSYFALYVILIVKLLINGVDPIDIAVCHFSVSAIVTMGQMAVYPGTPTFILISILATGIMSWLSYITLMLIGYLTGLDFDTNDTAEGIR